MLLLGGQKCLPFQRLRIMLCLKSRLYPAQFSIKLIPHPILHNLCLFHVWEEAEHHKLQESSSSCPFWNVNRLKKKKKISDGNETVLHFSAVFLPFLFQRECGNLLLEQPVGDLWRTKGVGSQTDQKQGRRIFNILQKLHECRHISTVFFTFSASGLCGRNVPVWKMS